MRSYELYFDESGNFEEATLLPDGGIVRAEAPQPGASQLVGILAPAGVATVAQAQEFLNRAHRAAGLVLGRRCHATELLKLGEHEKYGVLLDDLLAQFPGSGIQPVRLANSARLGFGDKVATYTSMVAEMVVRVFECLTRSHGGRIQLQITAAVVRTNGHQKEADPVFIDEAAYTSRLNEQITFAAVRRGVAHNRIQWSISSFAFGSGQTDRRLQICDILSNASYRNFRNCAPSQKRGLQGLLGECDFALNRSDVLDEIARHSKDGSLSHAVQTVAENGNRPELDRAVGEAMEAALDALVAQLAAMPSYARNIHLRQLGEWGSQFLVVRELDLADRMLRWLEERVAGPLLAMVSDPADEDLVWFPAQMLMLRLGQHNHRGELAAARTLSDRLQGLFPALAGRWEHTALVTESMTLRAVHLNDCCAYDEASRIMGAVVEFYGGLSSLMADALPGVFPKRVRSRHRGMALGTRMQSEMFAGLADPGRLAQARELNEAALDEFGEPADRQRQSQYRCQIETFAGNLAEARCWLAHSLGLDADTHLALAQAAASLEGAAQGFALLHWSRIAMEAARRDDRDELGRFREAFAACGLRQSRWVKEQKAEYPAHGILRHVAVADAAAGELGECRKVVTSLHGMNTKHQAALTLIKFAGVVEALSHWGGGHRAEVAKLMVKSPSLLVEMGALIDQHRQFLAFAEIASRLLCLWSPGDGSFIADRALISQTCRLVGQ